MMKKYALLGALAAFSSILTAQTTSLVQDLNPGTAHAFAQGNNNSLSSIPHIRFQNRLFIAADDGTTGTELWVIDNTMQSPVLLKDIRPGSAGSGVSSFAILGDHLYFAADDGVHGPELWRTDGTTAGTTLVLDARPGVSGVSPEIITKAGNRLYFRSFNGSAAQNGELWVSDGTAPGTTLLLTGLYDNLREFVAYHDSLYFSGFDGELWASNGLASGTARIKNIYPGGLPANILAMTVQNDRIYFQATTSANGREPWVSNGTEAGTFLLSDVVAGGGHSYAYAFHAFGPHVYFHADYKLWRTDGTPSGTSHFFNVSPTLAQYDPGSFASRSDMMFFPGITSGSTELWRTNGTAAGTVVVKDLNTSGSSDSEPQELTLDTVSGVVYFRAQANDGNMELWRSNGTSAGTFLIADLKSAGGSFPQAFTLLDQVLYFVADDGNNGRELWRFNPTSNTVEPLLRKAMHRCDPNPASDWIRISPTEISSEPLLGIRCTDQAGKEIWRTTHISGDVTTIPVATWKNGSYIVEFHYATGIRAQKVIIVH